MSNIFVPYKSNRPLKGVYSQFGALACPLSTGRLGSFAGPVVKIGPIAAQILADRKKGMTAQAALAAAMQRLAAQGQKVVTPAIHDQLAAGLQKIPGLSGF